MSKPDADHVETILEVGSEGGSIVLEGRRGEAGEWGFRIRTSEAVFDELLEEERDDVPLASQLPALSKSWDDALADLSRYAWPRLRPLVAHPQFREAIFAAVARHPDGGSEQVLRWRDLMRRRLAARLDITTASSSRWQAIERETGASRKSDAFGLTTTSETLRGHSTRNAVADDERFRYAMFWYLVEISTVRVVPLEFRRVHLHTFFQRLRPCCDMSSNLENIDTSSEHVADAETSPTEGFAAPASPSPIRPSPRPILLDLTDSMAGVSRGVDFRISARWGQPTAIPWLVSAAAPRSRWSRSTMVSTPHFRSRRRVACSRTSALPRVRW